MYYQIKPNLARIKHNYKNYFKADKDLFNMERG